jgi:hypothetical protein
MIILNFSHPLTTEQLAQAEALTGQTADQTLACPAHFDPELAIAPQVEALFRAIPLTPNEWQTLSLVVNPPSFNYITAYVLAELHGRMGYFAPLLCLKPAPNRVPPRYEVTEILNLQAVRDAGAAKSMTLFCRRSPNSTP